jgi:hypothetical protein
MRHTLNVAVKPAVIATSLSLLVSTATVLQADSFADALIGGKVSADVRMRYEYVDQDTNLDSADALTVRTRLGYNTGQFNGVDAFVEMENNSALVEDYNSGPGGNGKTKYSVIADPEATEVNQAYLGYAGIPDTKTKLGRQRIILDNSRFVGNVGWRQLEQTYDAGRVINMSVPGLALDYSYMDNVKDIFSQDVSMSNHLVNAAYTGLDFAKIVGYGYFLHFDGAAALRANSTQTLGGYIEGATAFDSFKLLYRAEYAKQSDYEDGDDGIDGDYLHFILGAEVSGVTGKAGYELLGSDDFSGFETPLATKHAFNGWADIFLNTPVEGLEDAYFLLSGSVAGVNLTGVYHDFQADSGSTDYGTEVDLEATYKFAKNYSAGIKYASYNADDFAVDTDKFWLWGQLAF